MGESSFMYGVCLAQDEKETELRQIVRQDIVSLLVPHFEGDDTDGLIQASSKLEEYIINGK